MEVALREMVEAELSRPIEKCSTREMDPDQREELWQESVRAYNAGGREEKTGWWRGASTTRNQEEAKRHRAAERHQDRCYHEPQLRGG